MDLVEIMAGDFNLEINSDTFDLLSMSIQTIFWIILINKFLIQEVEHFKASLQRLQNHQDPQDIPCSIEYIEGNIKLI